MAEFNYMIVTPNANEAYQPTVLNQVRAALEGIVMPQQIVPTNLRNLEKATLIARTEFPAYKLAVVVAEKPTDVSGILTSEMPVVYLSPKGLPSETIGAFYSIADGQPDKRLCSFSGNVAGVIRGLVQSRYSPRQFTAPDVLATPTQHTKHSKQ